MSGIDSGADQVFINVSLTDIMNIMPRFQPFTYTALSL